MHFICRASALSIRVCGFRYLALKLVPIKRFISRTLFETFTSTRTLSDSGYHEEASAVELRERFAQSDDDRKENAQSRWVDGASLPPVSGIARAGRNYAAEGPDVLHRGVVFDTFQAHPSAILSHSA